MRPAAQALPGLLVGRELAEVRLIAALDIDLRWRGSPHAHPRSGAVTRG